MQRLKALEALHKSCNPRCTTTKCRKDNCTLGLPRQGVLCVDCDRCKAFPKEEGEKRPDFIVLYAGGKSTSPRWFIVEMKGTVSDIGHIVAQFQAGAKVIQDNSRFRVAPSPLPLVPLLLHDGHIRADEFIRRRISFWGRPCEITIRRCGIELKHLLV